MPESCRDPAGHILLSVLKRLFTALSVIALLSSLPGPTQADPKKTVSSGPQATPPGPGQPGLKPLKQNLRGRRAVRGCPVGMVCRGNNPGAVMRELELENFKPGGPGSPWIDGDDAMGHNRVRYGGGSGRNPVPSRAGKLRRTRNPTPQELRPDLPWLKNLNMPDIPVRWTKELIKYLEIYKNTRRGRNTIRAWLRDQGRYRDMILAHLKKRKLPQDLLYVAMIESSYNPMTLSYAGASGLWQFMPAGAKIYGLQITRWVDERRDPIRSTKAVLDYFADLRQRFGNWHLALAAFNAGYNAILRSMSKYNTNDLWMLLQYENALPWDTRLYVPKVLATAIVGRNRKLFGVDNIKEAKPRDSDRVTVPVSVSLSTIARAAGVSRKAIVTLNPHLRRGRTPPRVRNYVVHVPKGRARMFAARFPQLRGLWDRYDAYVVRHGERFEDIAMMHGLSRFKLRRLNGLKHESEVRGGSTLVVPRVSAEVKKRNLARARAKLYRDGVPKGRKGDKLVVAVSDKNLRVRGKKRVFYRVVVGDTLGGIARSLRVRIRELAKWNDLDPKGHVYARMIVMAFVNPKIDFRKRGVRLLDNDKLWVVNRGSKEHLDETERRVGRKRVVITARGGETFKTLGKRYGMSRRDLARINLRPPNTRLKAGDKIVVYKVVNPRLSKKAGKQAHRAYKHNRRVQRAREAEKRRAEARKRKRVSKKAPSKKKPTRAKTAKTTRAKQRPKAKPPAKKKRKKRALPAAIRRKKNS